MAVPGTDVRVSFDVTTLGRTDSGICFGRDQNNRWCITPSKTICIVNGNPTDGQTGVTLSLGTWTFERLNGTFRVINPQGAIAATQACSFAMTSFSIDSSAPQAGTPVGRVIDNLRWLAKPQTNSAPTAPAVTVTPASPVDYEDVVCSVTSAATDADGDSLTYSFAWTKNGQAFNGATSSGALSSTVPASATTPGDVFSCTANANDGKVDGPASTASSTTVSDWVVELDLNFNNGSLSPLTTCIGCS